MKVCHVVVSNDKNIIRELELFIRDKEIRNDEVLENIVRQILIELYKEDV